MIKAIAPETRPPLSTFDPNNWRSDSPEGTCVETNMITGGDWDGWIGVRDSKDRGQGPVLTFTRAEWDAALAGHVRRAST
jgi:hypothetical protein